MCWSPVYVYHWKQRLEARRQGIFWWFEVVFRVWRDSLIHLNHYFDLLIRIRFRKSANGNEMHPTVKRLKCYPLALPNQHVYLGSRAYPLGSSMRIVHVVQGLLGKHIGVSAVMKDDKLLGGGREIPLVGQGIQSVPPSPACCRP